MDRRLNIRRTSFLDPSLWSAIKQNHFQFYVDFHTFLMKNTEAARRHFCEIFGFEFIHGLPVNGLRKLINKRPRLKHQKGNKSTTY